MSNEENKNEYIPSNGWKGCEIWDNINFELYAKIKRVRRELHDTKSLGKYAK